MGIDLPVIWAIIIAFGLMMYVIMDGFDLGIGILFPFIPDRGDRDVMVNTVAPVWDGNDLARPGRGVLAGGFPARLFRAAQRVVLPAAADARRADLAWRGFRIPLQGR
jgi:cytochrome bd ubiquinol oxidase subunit II